jgi:hypothetical protein
MISDSWKKSTCVYPDFKQAITIVHGLGKMGVNEDFRYLIMLMATMSQGLILKKVRL